MCRISVIVPVYNVAQYIERCARSLFNQTLDDIEYLFINDCTPDESMAILSKVVEEYPNRKDSVKILDMPANSKQAKVREFGIEQATGDYIIHCDSDDWVDTDLYEKMYNEAINSGADVVFCPFKDEYMDHSTVRKWRTPAATGKGVIESRYATAIEMFTWNKLVRRSIYTVNEILPFEGINMWEDNGLMMRILYYADRVSEIKGSYYHYNQANVNAMTNGYGRKAIDQMLECAKKLDDFFSRKPDAKRFEKTMLSIKFLARINLVTTRFDWLREYSHTFPESDAIINELTMDSFSAKGKIRFLFVKYHLAWLFVLLFKVKNLIDR